MAKFKDTDLELTRAMDEMRDVEVQLDFTPNALASVSVSYTHLTLPTICSV